MLNSVSPKSKKLFGISIKDRGKKAVLDNMTLADAGLDMVEFAGFGTTSPCALDRFSPLIYYELAPPRGGEGR